jgi:starch synthase (maltosyl-transferring)
MKDLKKTVVIEHVTPAVDGGRYPAKREVGATIEVSADIFKDGHDRLLAWVKYRRWDAPGWHESPMRFVDNDRWSGEFRLTENTRYVFTIEAVTDQFRSWLEDLVKRVTAGQSDVTSELLEGAALVRDAARRAADGDREALDDWARRIGRASDQATAVAAAGDPALAALMDRYVDRSDSTWCEREFEIVSDRERARFATWYEFFPRSSPTPGSHGTLKEAEHQLRRAAAMGFDVVYLPPIHPIGRTNRKGRNNALEARPDDPGSPWAIGAEEGGHTALHPDLGTLEDFDRFVVTAETLGLEVALDFTIQASPDHPWVREHPEWFFHRPDGTIKYAENPPKKYQDVYPLNFTCPDPEPLWREIRRVLEFWISHGVKTFRVDNPHTKPVKFWEWLIRDVQNDHPDVVFLAEAFTRPKVMRVLAKAGFTQSYTYFTWRNAQQELADYFTEITSPPVSDYFRGHLWPNTPDILHETLQTGGRPAFKMRLVLAATLSSLYGIYSGYELCENVPREPDSEEYLNSEKYELKARDWDSPGNLGEFITRVNAIRRRHRALQLYDNLRFYTSASPNVLWYGKMTPARDDVLFVAASLDVSRSQDSFVEVPIDELGLREDEPYVMHELLSDGIWQWRGRQGYVKLDPHADPAQIFVLRRLQS